MRFPKDSNLQSPMIPGSSMGITPPVEQSVQAAARGAVFDIRGSHNSNVTLVKMMVYDGLLYL